MLFNKNTESVCGGFKKCPILTLESHLGHTFSECSIIELYNRIVFLFMFYYRNDNCNEEAVALDSNAALLNNKARSNRQGSEAITGVT